MRSLEQRRRRRREEREREREKRESEREERERIRSDIGLQTSSASNLATNSPTVAMIPVIIKIIISAKLANVFVRIKARM